MSLLSEITSNVVSGVSVEVPTMTITSVSSAKNFAVPDIITTKLKLGEHDLQQNGTLLSLPGSTFNGNLNITGAFSVDQGGLDVSLYLPDAGQFLHVLNFSDGLLKSVGVDTGFQFQINTTLTSPGSSLNNQFKLPLVDPVNPLNPRSFYRCAVFWGDGTVSSITQWNVGTTHTYATPGVKNITILGQCYGWEFNNQGDKLKFLNVTNWGQLFRLGPFTVGHFYGCSNMVVTAPDSLNLGLPTDPFRTRNTEYTFGDCSSLTTISILNTANLTQTDHMFDGCTQLNDDFSDWNVQNVLIMSDMFRGCTAFKQDLSAWQPYACLDMTNMFFGVNLNTPGNQNNFDNLLVSWGNNPRLANLQRNVPFSGGNSQYSYVPTVLEARGNLQNKGWLLTDGGPVLASNNFFQFRVRTNNPGITASNTFRMPLRSDGTYNFTINWGDGSTQTITSHLTNTHVYAVAGDYTITITGTCIGWNFSEIIIFGAPTTDARKMLQVFHWGLTFHVGANVGGYFAGCRNMTITAPVPPYWPGLTNWSFMFHANIVLQITNFYLWNVSAVTNMESFLHFAYNSSFSPNEVFNGWNVSNVTNMKNMLRSLSYFNYPLDKWDVSNVTTMEGMFYETQRFSQDISAWDVSNVTNMSYMFYNTYYNVSLNAWDVSSVTNMSYMFSNTNNFNQPLNNWNTSSVTNMSYMFLFANAFNQNINSWNVSNVTNMQSMFQNAQSFNQPLSNWNVSNVTNMSGMFSVALNFNHNINNWNVSNVLNMVSMFQSAVSFNSPIGNWNVGNVTNMAFMFSDAREFNQDIGNWNTTNVLDMQVMFANANKFNNGENPVMNWNVSNVTNMFQMFYQAFKFNRNLSNWVTSSVTNMNIMFCSYSGSNYVMEFNNGDTPGLVPGTKPLTWNTANVTNMAEMFRGCRQFNQSLSSWNTNKVTDLTRMFQGFSDAPSEKHLFNNGYGPSDNSHPMGWTFNVAPTSTDYRRFCNLTNGNKPASLP